MHPALCDAKHSTFVITVCNSLSIVNDCLCVVKNHVLQEVTLLICMDIDRKLDKRSYYILWVAVVPAAFTDRLVSWNCEHYGFADNQIYIWQWEGKVIRVSSEAWTVRRGAIPECIQQPKQIRSMSNPVLLGAALDIFVLAALQSLVTQRPMNVLFQCQKERTYRIEVEQRSDC